MRYAATAGLWMLMASSAGWAQGTGGRASFRAESIVVARNASEVRSDSSRAHARSVERARQTLSAPVAFARGAIAPTPDGGQLLKVKAWYLWFNRGLTLRIVGHPDSGLDADAARAQGRARADTVRGILRARGIEAERLLVAEPAPGPVAAGGGVGFQWSGPLSWIEVPPADADPPAWQPVDTALSATGRLRYRWGTVRIFYATDRRRSGAADPETFYDGQRSPNGALELGRLEVSVPRVHRPGVLERPVWYRLERSPDSTKHVVVRAVQPMEQAAAFDSLRRAVADSRDKEALVFIHGYNVTFHEAALRAAQLTYDVGFDGAPILYSWPSRGSLFQYSADREASEWSAEHLRVFLDSISAVTGAKRIHVVAHSMGNRVMALALQKMAAAGRKRVFDNVVLAAPDIDASLFEQQIAPAIRPLARRMTIYMSSNDKALWLSRALSTNVRLGEATSPMLVVRRTDTIDASDVRTDLLGHGYIASAKDLIDDLVLLLNQRRPPPRGRLQLATAEGNRYWRLR